MNFILVSALSFKQFEIMYWTGSKDVKDLLNRVLQKKSSEINGKVVIDAPAGSGFTTKLLLDLGAKVHAFDLFPEFFQEKRIRCEVADLSEMLPMASKQADWVIFQEGIEHLPDQLKALKEMNRVLKPGGHMIVTTPNYSNLRSRMSHLLMESENLRVLPPNEVDSIWFSKTDTGRMYYGHIFSIGIQRLRMLAKLAGFEIVQVHPARVNWTSLFLYLNYWHLILWKLWSIRRRSVRKGGFREIPEAYLELSELGNSLNVLCSGHLIVEFKKIHEPEQVARELKTTYSSFEVQT